MEQSGFIKYIVILILILINGFFSGTEMAIVSVNKNKLQVLVDKGDKRAALLSNILEEPSKLLSTIQISVTISGFLASAFTAVGITEVLEYYLIQLNIPYSKEISIFVITVILSYVTLVLGELVPKRIGLRYSDQIALKTINFINILYKLLLPFIIILSVSTNIILRLINFDLKDIKEEITKEEIKNILDGSSATGVMEENELNMIKKVIEFDEKSAREIMKPRTSLFAVEVNENINDLLNDESFSKYSRIPVYEEDLDNIIGILHVKEILLTAYEKGFENINIRNLIKEAYFMPESISINTLFKNMKNGNKHMTILIDEYGGVSGMVTLEDLLEELVGDISDEFDIDDDKIVKITNKKYLVECDINLSDLNERLDINLESENYDTLNGFLIEKMSFIPNENDEIPNLKIDNLTIVFRKIGHKKIDKVIIEKD